MRLVCDLPTNTAEDPVETVNQPVSAEARSPSPPAERLANCQGTGSGGGPSVTASCSVPASSPLPSAFLLVRSPQLCRHPL